MLIDHLGWTILSTLEKSQALTDCLLSATGNGLPLFESNDKDVEWTEKYLELR